MGPLMSSQLSGEETGGNPSFFKEFRMQPDHKMRIWERKKPGFV